MSYQQEPQGTNAGCLAILLSTVIVYKVARPFAELTETIMRHEGIETGKTLIGVTSFILLWAGMAHLIQFIMDEYIVLPFMQKKRAADARRYMMLIDGGKRTSSGKKWVFALLLLGGLWLYFK
ncbi:MAG: hypothetical protein MUF15_21975 [Acidobacteria bacterium]|nr:hypothetical protein [Acidobacteriota bacterium]